MSPAALSHLRAADDRAVFQLTGQPPTRTQWPLLAIRRVLVLATS
jgi:hypothetical protein